MYIGLGMKAAAPKLCLIQIYNRHTTDFILAHEGVRMFVQPWSGIQLFNLNSEV